MVCNKRIRSLPPAIISVVMVSKGYFWKIVLFSIMLALLNLCGAILLGIGLLVTIPISLFATAHFYDKMKIVHTPKVAALE